MTAYVRSLPPTETANDETYQIELTNTAYAPGTPEIGTTFLAPPSGRVRITVGGGLSDNGGSARDRIILTVQLWTVNTDGSEVIQPVEAPRALISCANNSLPAYGCTVSMAEGLTPGQLYYIRLMHATSAGTDPDTADITYRSVIVIPMP